MDAQGFLDYIGKSKARTTAKSYRNGLRHFCEYLKGEYSVEKLSEILEERKATLQSENPLQKRKFERYIEEWHRHQVNNGCSINSARTRYVAACQFFKFFDLDLKVGIIPSEVKASVLSERDYVLTVEDLRKMYKAANLRGRALLLTAKDLGLRLSDFQRIKVSQLPNLDRKAPIPLNVMTRKEHITSRGFLSAETVSVLKDYLESLQKHGDTEYLWPSNSNRKKPMSQQGIGKWLKTIAKEAGIETEGLSFHCFRRLLLRGAIESGIGLTAGKLMVGKAVPRSDETYIVKVKLEKAFAKLSKYLNVTGVDHEAPSDLKKSVIAQQKEIASLHSTNKEHKKRLDILSEDLEKVQHQRNQLGKNVEVLTTQVETLQKIIFSEEDEMTKQLRQHGYVVEFKTVKVLSLDSKQKTVKVFDIDGFAKGTPGQPKDAFICDLTYTDEELEREFGRAAESGQELEVLVRGRKVIKLSET